MNSENFRRHLEETTREFHALADPTDVATLSAFRSKQPSDKFVKDVPNCPFVGFVDWSPDRKENDTDTLRPGCLVHPIQLGVDRRDCGVYDRETCEEFLCAAHSVWTSLEKNLVVSSISDSYVYGLVISDPTFVRQLFKAVAQSANRSLTEHDVSSSKVRIAAGEIFSLKKTWPFGERDAILGQVTIVDDEVVPRDPLTKMATDPITMLALCLGTKTDRVDEARDHLNRLIDSVVNAMNGG